MGRREERRKGKGRRRHRKEYKDTESNVQGISGVESHFFTVLFF